MNDLKSRDIGLRRVWYRGRLQLVTAFATLSLVLAASRLSWVAAENWWNDAWHFRVPITVSSGDYARNDKAAEVEINFTTLLNSLGQSGGLNVASIRVIEVTAAGKLINDAVPFQFDLAADFDAANNAHGTLVFILTGQTAASATRHYHIYFDTAGSFTPPPVTTRVVLTDNIEDEGFASYRVVTDNASYFYHKQGGGFSSLVDANDIDWIGWNSHRGTAGDLRGIPNLVHEDDGGYFHPGRTTSSSMILNQGPLKATLQSTSNDGLWEVQWAIFPTYARMTVLKANSTYWFQYEGVPGGTLQGDLDFIVRADGVQNLASESWTGDLGNLPGDEWVFMADPNANRAIFLAHHTEDLIVDSYRPSNGEKMTIFGFGRDGNNRYLSQVPKQFTIGLVDATTLEGVAPVVRNAYKPLDISLSTAEQQNGLNRLYLPLVFDGEL